MFENTKQTEVPFWDKVYTSKMPFFWLAPCPFSRTFLGQRKQKSYLTAKRLEQSWISGSQCHIKQDFSSILSCDHISITFQLLWLPIYLLMDWPATLAQNHIPFELCHEILALFLSS